MKIGWMINIQKEMKSSKVKPMKSLQILVNVVRKLQRHLTHLYRLQVIHKQVKWNLDFRDVLELVDRPD